MENTVCLVNELGLHARPISKWLGITKKYETTIEVTKNGKKYNGTSMISLMSMAAKKGDELTLLASGLDADKVISELSELIKCGFGE